MDNLYKVSFRIDVGKAFKEYERFAIGQTPEIAVERAIMDALSFRTILEQQITILSVEKQ